MKKKVWKTEKKKLGIEQDICFSLDKDIIVTKFASMIKKE